MPEDETEPAGGARPGPTNPPFVAPEPSPFVPPPQPAAATSAATPGATAHTVALPASRSRSSSRRRSFAILGIVLGALALLALLSWCVSLIVSAVTELRTAGPFGPGQGWDLVEGDPGPPTALSPLDCAAACFTAETIPTLVPSESAFVELGLTDATFPYGTYGPTTVGEMYPGFEAAWTRNAGAPDACFFAPTNAPVSGRPDSSLADSTDVVEFIGTHEDSGRWNTLDQAVRVFPDSAAASDYMADLSAAVEECEQVSYDAPDRYVAEVAPEAALRLPDSVAGVGWVRTGDPGVRWRAHVIDLQRGNVVVRTRLLTDGSIDDIHFRTWVEGYSLILSSIAPSQPQ